MGGWRRQYVGRMLLEERGSLDRFGERHPSASRVKRRRNL